MALSILIIDLELKYTSIIWFIKVEFCQVYTVIRALCIYLKTTLVHIVIMIDMKWEAYSCTCYLIFSSKKKLKMIEK